MLSRVSLLLLGVAVCAANTGTRQLLTGRDGRRLNFGTFKTECDVRGGAGGVEICCENVNTCRARAGPGGVWAGPRAIAWTVGTATSIPCSQTLLRRSRAPRPPFGARGDYGGGCSEQFDNKASPRRCAPPSGPANLCSASGHPTRTPCAYVWLCVNV